MTRGSAEARPTGYAVINDKTPAWCRYFRQHEGIHALTYDTGGDDWTGFDRWLEAIHGRTSAKARLSSFFRGKKIVWVDPKPSGNRYGIDRLKSAGADVVEVTDARGLVRASHQSATLMISNYGYHAEGDADVHRVLRTIQTWEDRPPVVVFASGSHARDNRRDVLRRGAFEYVCGWKDLFRVIETLHRQI